MSALIVLRASNLGDLQGKERSGPQCVSDVINALLPHYPAMAAITSATTGTPGVAGINPALLQSFRNYQYSTPVAGIELEFSSLKEIDDKTQHLNSSYDLIFVDPWHTYEDSLLILELAIRLAKPESVILTHDCLTHNASLSSEYIPGAWSGVTCFVFREFAKTVKREYFVLDRDHGIGVLGPEVEHLNPALNKVDVRNLEKLESENLLKFVANPREFMRGISSTSFTSAMDLIERGESPAHLTALNPHEPVIKNSRIPLVRRYCRKLINFMRTLNKN